MRIATLYGGQADRQADRRAQGPPADRHRHAGRLLDLMNRGNIRWFPCTPWCWTKRRNDQHGLVKDVTALSMPRRQRQLVFTQPPHQEV
jgi:hypothetical protein